MPPVALVTVAVPRLTEPPIELCETGHQADRAAALESDDVIGHSHPRKRDGALRTTSGMRGVGVGPGPLLSDGVCRHLVRRRVAHELVFELEI